MVTSVWTGLLILAGLIVVTGLFVAAEYALISIRKSRVDEMVQNGVPGALVVQALKQRIDKTIAGSQLGITLLSMTLGWVGGEVMPEVAKWFLGYIPSFGGIPPGSIAFAVSFMVLTMVHVIIGEQIPKQIALRIPEKTIVRLSYPLRVFCFLTAPFVWVMHTLSLLGLRLLGIPKREGQEHLLPSADEFQILFDESEKAGTLGKQESNLLRKALDLKAVTAREVMIPRTRMDAISENMSLNEVLAVITKTKHSKLPVYRGRDRVVGILNTRDLFDLWSTTNKTPQAVTAPFKVSTYIRRAYFVPETMLASNLLEEMRVRQIQMAIVMDEFGATVGLITLEDLLEELVGEIWDEYDTPNYAIDKIDETAWRVQGEVTLFEFNRAFGTSIDCLHCTTIAGMVVELLGRQPRVDDTATTGAFAFTVLELSGHAISSLKVRRVGQGTAGGCCEPEAPKPAEEPKVGTTA